MTEPPRRCGVEKAAINDSSGKLARSAEINARVMNLLQRRIKLAQERFSAAVREGYARQAEALRETMSSPWNLWWDWIDYGVDFSQRSVLFWDTLRRRGSAFVDHERGGKRPAPHFRYETVLDARSFERPVNCALLRVVPPAEMSVASGRRPYIIIDPWGGHGPELGGLEEESQADVALRGGHPVYCVSFLADPAPGQTLAELCKAQAAFVRRVREMHSHAARPVIVGNCQGGWAAMMLAVSGRDDAGPVVIDGAPMSRRREAWRERKAADPTREPGGLPGGTWLASMTEDLANGRFDSVRLRQDFENLNPADTFWNGYKNLFAGAATGPARFFEFERWWGGFYLLNREEIEWLVQNLFAGSEPAAGSSSGSRLLDLREINSPIVLLACLGDGVTPPHQAFHWVADLYGSTDEIRARGKVIVGLMQEDAGWLSAFVSGKLASEEPAQAVSVLKRIEALPPGLYGMHIRPAGGAAEPEVRFEERRLEDVVARLGSMRADQEPVEAVAALSEFNLRAYELFAQPLVRAVSDEFAATLQQAFDPLRAQRWALSDMNPWLQWLGPMAEFVKSQRCDEDEDQPMRRMERFGSDLIAASLDYYREVRDAMSEAAFLQVYGALFAFCLDDLREEDARGREP